MATIVGLRDLKAKLKGLVKKFSFSDYVVVGYTQQYAIFVHEIQASHKVGQWKYLETPARVLKPELAKIGVQAMKSGATGDQALMLMGQRLKGESQRVYVPVDTSALKASAFVSFGRNVRSASAAAKQRGESKKFKGRKLTSKTRSKP